MKQALLLFTKVPHPGRVKTRLVGAHGLSPEEACSFYSAILRDIFDIVRNVARSTTLRFYVCYSPRDEGAVLKKLLLDSEAAKVSFFPQIEEASTAERIALGFDRAFHDGSDTAVMVFGDQPRLEGKLFLEAFQSLEEAAGKREQRLVLGPTCDGGTYLIGLTSGLLKWLHNSIDCTNSGTAVSKLIVKARASNTPLTLLSERNDLDDLDDLTLLKNQPPSNYPRTTGLLKTLPPISSQNNEGIITVIIPTLNEEKTLERTIMSIRHQPNRCEIVVVDGGSGDRTLDVANRLADRVLITNGSGRQHQENVGARGAKGSILLFLHADTLVPPTLLQSVRASLQDQRVVAGGAHLIYSPPERFRYKAFSALRDLGSRLLRISGMGSAFFIRRDTFRVLGGFDEEMNEEAVDMCKKLRDLGKIVMLDEVVQSSARRYERSGFIRTFIAWGITIALSYFGIRAVTIEKYVWRVVR